MNEPICGKCGQVMTPQNSRVHPELFLHDACLPAQDEWDEDFDGDSSVCPACHGSGGGADPALGCRQCRGSGLYRPCLEDDEP